MLKSISLFTGIGGLDYGFEAAGFKTVVAAEHDRVVARTLRTNTRWKVIEQDVNSLSPKELLSAAQIKKGGIDILIAGPPCQPFSKAAFWNRNGAAGLNDPRARTLWSFLNILEHTRPRAFFVENVPGFAFRGKSSGLQFLLDGIADINSRCKTNYCVNWAKLNAAEYGVPQVRERVFVVGSRDGHEFQFPDPTHGLASECNGSREPFRTAWDAVGDLPKTPNEPGLEVTGKWANLLPSVPEGKNYLWHTNRGGGEQLFGWRTRYWSFLLKLAKDQPSWTIQSQAGSATGPFTGRTGSFRPKSFSGCRRCRTDSTSMSRGQKFSAWPVMRCHHSWPKFSHVKFEASSLATPAPPKGSSNLSRRAGHPLRAVTQ